jgi:hypothetical protein
MLLVRDEGKVVDTMLEYLLNALRTLKVSSLFLGVISFNFPVRRWSTEARESSGKREDRGGDRRGKRVREKGKREAKERQERVQKEARERQERGKREASRDRRKARDRGQRVKRQKRGKIEAREG